MAKPVLHMLGSGQFLILYLGSESTTTCAIARTLICWFFLGGIVANLVSMGYSNVVEGRDKGSMGASGMQLAYAL